MSRLRDFDPPTGAPIRYVRERPGELLHLDIKKLGRIPAGGGHRVLGWDRGERNRDRGLRGKVGYDYLHVAVDDCSRVAYVEAMADDRAPTTARFLQHAAAFFASMGVPIERVLTDRAMTYTKSHEFARLVDELGARHLVTRPYRPQTNGKAERFIQTLLREWAYAKPYTTNAARLRDLPRWLRTYNHKRPHTALLGQTPIDVICR